MSDRKAMKRQMAKGLSKKQDGNGAITGHATDTASTPYAIIDGKRVAVLHGRVAKTPDGRIHEVFGVDFASAGTQSVMHKGVYECHGNGNAAAMQEVLERVIDYWSRFDVTYPPERKLRDMAQAALAAPPRNCDRFANHNDAVSEFEKDTGYKEPPPNDKTSDTFWWAFGKWLYATAQEGGAK